VAQSQFVPFRITVCGVEELDAHCETGVSHVLSILDPGMPQPPAFGSFGEHARLDMRFDDVIEEEVEGKQPPTEAHVRALLAFGAELTAESGPYVHLLVHCWAGISRSTAAMTLILAQARPDRPPAEALDEVRRIRSMAWPNLRILEFGDRLLGFDGTLLSAARAHYRGALDREPSIATFMEKAGRSRELAMAGR
jgi:predicted protein tyrosine phosphatase